MALETILNALPLIPILSYAIGLAYMTVKGM